MNSEMNLADGHARQALTTSQAVIIDSLPELFRMSAETPVEQLESRAHGAFFHALGQHEYPGADGRVLACYSSSVAMEILSRAVVTEIDQMALLHPTFDNIPDILRGVGITLRPIEEDLLHDADLPDSLLDSVGAVFVTTPNNPTGRVVDEERLRRLAEQCREHDVVLCLDTSFRGFDPRAQYDHYAVLEQVGCRWAVVEDTGKLWPTLDLKVGWLVTSANLNLPVDRIYSDILLGVSPLILTLVEHFARDAANGGFAELHEFIQTNRSVVRGQLAGLPGLSFPDLHSTSSVERVQVDGRSSMDIWAALREENVHVLPCHRFHWFNPAEGDRTIRFALARQTNLLESCAKTLRSILADG
ncbi:enduracididine biosynthesis enzyme MppP [Saccharothrix sp. ALI-22-I]|uniref:enduracididine biosynthesis enzyme MppP n=1 Tax=Saccharothrix sp. ALI-22-I TaxID=1933778 RepID=UPI001930FCBE|nr:enduracididine biosynthesis enzyme MppP [Saccharothrix sp. ALI-22-I]